MTKYYPAIATIIAWFIGQFSKPFIYYGLHKQWKKELFLASGSIPSSHSSTVSALALSIGLIDKFSTNAFYLSAVFAIIVCYDAANVRYYSGQNITIVQRLLADLKELTTIPLSDPIYEKKMKEVLGHTYIEVFFGILLGISVALITYFIIF